ncbi:hypothetical protein ACF08M_31110 [Streptomyces sp. NPDC015032]|uniref:hypothetical protein n=1 Tax=Streptomyces sp. NPDC015032 TaxID=3364937 RepID=UPI0036FBC55A
MTEETPEYLAPAAADPLVAGVVGWADLTSVVVTDALVTLRALPGGDRLVAIRHQVQGQAAQGADAAASAPWAACP